MQAPAWGLSSGTLWSQAREYSHKADGAASDGGHERVAFNTSRSIRCYIELITVQLPELLDLGEYLRFLRCEGNNATYRGQACIDACDPHLNAQLTADRPPR